MSLKNSNDTIGNRTRDLPVCSVVPFLRRLGIKFCHFSTYMYHIPELLCWAVFDVLVCNIFFRELFRFLMAGEAGFGPERGVTSMEVVRDTVPLVTAVTNWSAMEPEVYLRSPWLR